MSSVSSKYKSFSTLVFLHCRGWSETGDGSSLFTVIFLWEGENKTEGVFCSLGWTHTCCWQDKVWCLIYTRLEGRMLCCMHMWLLQTTKIHTGEALSIKRDAFTYITYKYLYKEWSGTSVSGLLYKIVSLKAWCTCDSIWRQTQCSWTTYLCKIPSGLSSQAGCEN